MPEFRLPEDLSTLTRAELAELKATANSEFSTILERDQSTWTLADSKAAQQFAAAITAINTADAEFASFQAEANAAVDADRAYTSQLNTQPEEPAGGDTGGGEDVSAGAEALTGELVTASTKSAPVLKDRTLNSDLRTRHLREGSAHQAQMLTPTQAELIITASSDVPEFAMHTRFENNAQLATAMHARAQQLGITRGDPSYVSVAKVKNVYDTVLHDRIGPAEVEAALKKLTNPQNLYADNTGLITTAGGGWCAPSVNRYQFFDATCEDGMVDLPTVGIERGGINFPTSPSMADVFTGAFDVTTNPWLWTETDDIATVTGAPNKPCVRVPCPTFTNVRLECYGICLTAGNLTDNAYPEATQHQIRLLNAAHYHASNQRYLQQMVAQSTAAITGGAGGAGVISPVLYMIELAAEDYRTRFGMCQNDVLEVVLPHWILAAMRADAAKRTGVDLIGVTDARIADWLDMRKVRAQFVSDWQVRATGLPGFTETGSGFNSWPTSVQFMIYAAGTFVRGNGMSLNLGVVRDSTLNAENDHTALWMEECHLIARFGFQSRLYTVNICADGTTGAADLTACTP